MNTLVTHLVETYGLEVALSSGGLQDASGERSWELPIDPAQGDRAMAALRQAEPRS